MASVPVNVNPSTVSWYPPDMPYDAWARRWVRHLAATGKRRLIRKHVRLALARVAHLDRREEWDPQDCEAAIADLGMATALVREHLALTQEVTTV